MSHTLSQKEFHTKQDAINTNLAPNLVAYNVPGSEFGTIAHPKGAYDTIYPLANEDMKATRNHIQVAQLQDATDVYKPVIQHIEAAWIKNNPFIPNSVKIAMFCHIDSGVRHKHEGPSTIPVAGLPDYNVPRHVGFHYRDSATPTKTAKPDPDDVCEAWVYIIPAPVAGVTPPPPVFIYRNDSSVDKISIPFSDTEAGKDATVRLCWKNKKGRGEFSVDIPVLIPR